MKFSHTLIIGSQNRTGTETEELTETSTLSKGRVGITV